ncbi:MAG: hypothetical protein HY216_14800 [Candidatus Rokubacteria bacterium]|nr:hypothetical protein [Candidatus Rokubacteria bacterium]
MTIDELWVCFAEPPEPPAHAAMLSFLHPGAETTWEARLGRRFICGRLVAREVRPDARRQYIDLIARIGATPVGGRTLRERLRGDFGGSRWWFTKTSEKDCEWREDLYTTVIRLAAVQCVTERLRITRVRVFGAPADLARVIERRGADNAGFPWGALVRGLGARAGLIRSWLRTRRGLGRTSSPSRFDVLLHAQWGWSLTRDKDGFLRDHYLGDLAAQLTRRGLRVGWLTVCDPDAAGNAAAGRDGAVVADVGHDDRVVALERLVGAADVVRRVLDLRALVRFARLERTRGFRELFEVVGVDLYPLLRRQIIGALAGPGIPRCELLALAAERACRATMPRVVVTFLELFLQARALYAGIRRAPRPMHVWTAEHGIYGRDKLFGVVEPKRELHGEPDGLAVPQPDGIFVMGDFSREMWVENGFPAERVIMTGGLRYQHVAVARRPAPASGRARVLVVGSINEESGLDMCDAITTAARGLDGVTLRFRNHPVCPLSEAAAFASYRSAMDVSRASLDEDLTASDLVVFDHSSVAEEALLRGIPVWHWLWPGVNESAFLDLPGAPAYTSIVALRAALQAFTRNPTAFAPSPEDQRLVAQRCFGDHPAGASARIADIVLGLVRSS